MVEFKKYLEPNRKGFESDPFGYSALARHKWGMAQAIAGFPIDISKPATRELLGDVDAFSAYRDHPGISQ